jgi:hypothetical protein
MRLETITIRALFPPLVANGIEQTLNEQDCAASA